MHLSTDTCHLSDRKAIVGKEVDGLMRHIGRSLKRESCRVTVLFLRCFMGAVSLDE